MIKKTLIKGVYQTLLLGTQGRLVMTFTLHLL